jgi:hypothetical protein
MINKMLGWTGFAALIDIPAEAIAAVASNSRRFIMICSFTRCFQTLENNDRFFFQALEEGTEWTSGDTLTSQIFHELLEDHRKPIAPTGRARRSAFFPIPGSGWSKVARNEVYAKRLGVHGRPFIREAPTASAHSRAAALHALLLHWKQARNIHHTK